MVLDRGRCTVKVLVLLNDQPAGKKSSDSNAERADRSDDACCFGMAGGVARSTLSWSGEGLGRARTAPFYVHTKYYPTLTIKLGSLHGFRIISTPVKRYKLTDNSLGKSGELSTPSARAPSHQIWPCG